MAGRRKGKFLILSFIVFCSRFLASSSSDLIQPEHEPQDELDPTPHHPEPDYYPETMAPKDQQILLQKLDELVRNLSEIVTRLESRLSEPPAKAGHGNGEVKIVDESIANEVEQGAIRDGQRPKAVSVATKYSPFWSERFQFVSAVKLNSDASCIHVLPSQDSEGLSKYAAVGDEKGTVYIFSRNGKVLVEFYTASESPITAMLSYVSIYKNESILITGHKNGDILMHKLWERSSGEEYSSLVMENVAKFASGGNGEDGLPVTNLEVHYVGRTRYVLSMDVRGMIRVFKENGTLYGSVMPASKPLAFLKQRLLFLTETGAGSLDLRNMKIRESECEGMNHSLARNYVFDVTEWSKAYGLTSDGDLFHVTLLGDIINFKCRVRFKKKFDMDEPLVFQAIKGYLLIVNEAKVSVYNVSALHYGRVGGPRLLFSTSLDEIRSSFLLYQGIDVDSVSRKMIPLAATDREKFVVIGIGGGYMGMYRSNLPVFKGEHNSMLWTSPVFLFILFLFGAWHFFAKKKDSLISWGPEDPFSPTSATTRAPLGSGSGDRSFVDPSSRNADVDLRGGALRAPPRRYGSPTRYPGGVASSFRPSSVADPNSRPASSVDPNLGAASSFRPSSAADPNPRPAIASAADPNFRTTGELKYRGSTVESAGYPKRRESLFVNSQVLDDAPPESQSREEPI